METEREPDPESYEITPDMSVEEVVVVMHQMDAESLLQYRMMVYKGVVAIEQFDEMEDAPGH